MTLDDLGSTLFCPKFSYEIFNFSGNNFLNAQEFDH